MTQDQLEDLVVRAGRADPDAWEALYRRVYPGLMAYASRRLDRERAMDAVAETMARAIARIDRFEWRGGGFDAWLYGILRHVVVDAHRARERDGRRRSATIPTRPARWTTCSTARTRPRCAPRSRVLHADDRELLELRVVAGLTAEEVGDVLGKRPGAVRMAQSRALERLRRELERGA